MGPVFAQFGNANLVVFVSFCGFEALPSEQVTADGSPGLPSTLFCLHFFPSHSENPAPFYISC